MTRSEAYAEGFHEGRRWAEEDIRNGTPDGEYAYNSGERADVLGYRRGYRDTVARWNAGTLTWEMLEHAPVNR